VIVWAVSKELLDQRCVAPENIALANHALVRQFAGVDRELFGQKCKTQHASKQRCRRRKGPRWSVRRALPQAIGSLIHPDLSGGAVSLPEDLTPRRLSSPWLTGQLVQAGLLKLYFLPGTTGAPSSGALSTCSKVAHSHCGSCLDFITTCRPTSPTSRGSQVLVLVSRISAVVV
jgi:hypothetical protein